MLRDLIVHSPTLAAKTPTANLFYCSESTRLCNQRGRHDARPAIAPNQIEKAKLLAGSGLATRVLLRTCSEPTLLSQAQLRHVREPYALLSDFPPCLNASIP